MYLRRGRSTQANFGLGHRLFLLRPVLLRAGATWANFWLVLLTIQNVKMKKKKEKCKKKGREKETKGWDNQHSPCFGEGVAGKVCRRSKGGGLGFRVRVQGSGFRVQGSGFRVQGSGFRVQGSGFKVQGSGFKVFRSSGLQVFRSSGLQVFRSSGLQVFRSLSL